MKENKYVMIRIENVFYAIDISLINSITQSMNVTKIPNLPKHTEGVINLRGDVIPLLNLRCLFNVSGEYNSDCRIIIYKNMNRCMGILVDEASEVISVNNDEIDDVHSILGNRIDNCISGIAKVKNQIVVILDLERVMDLVS